MGKKIVIIGGGFFGLYLAEHLAMKKHEVFLFERESDLMQRASYTNQARVHNGYHYPRSVLTALRSRVSFSRFCEEFAPSIDDTFEKYYLIGRILGKIRANQFEKFCQRIGAPCEPAPADVMNLCNPRLIEAGYAVIEHAFNTNVLKDIMRDRVEKAGVKLFINASVEKLLPCSEGLSVSVNHLQEENPLQTYVADHVFNCTYSQINGLAESSGMPMIPFKHELAEMCLVDVPRELKNKGLTVMCGPFFSVMPFPALGLHSFSHVRYTPHFAWREEVESPNNKYSRDSLTQGRRSAWKHMLKDAERYLPLLGHCKFNQSMWEIKTVLPQSESSDSRPILFKMNHAVKGYHCLMGGKIDNVYDAIQAISEMGLDE